MECDLNKHKTQQPRFLSGTLLTLFLICGSVPALLSSQAFGQEDRPKQVWYRYNNEHGVKVINFTIPSEFARNGYEIITQTGRVVKVVDPAPDKDTLEAKRLALDAQKAEEKRRQAAITKYRELKKRYPNLSDIDAAEVRKIEGINTNISIQKGNIVNIDAQIEQLSRTAANYERANRAIPKQVIEGIEELESQRTSVEETLKVRTQELEHTQDDFAEARKVLSDGLAAEQKKTSVTHKDDSKANQ